MWAAVPSYRRRPTCPEPPNVLAGCELRVISETEGAARGISGENALRTRGIDYGGWGGNGLPLIEANDEYVAANPDKEKLGYYSARPKDSTEYSISVIVNGETVAVPVTGIQRFPSGDLPAVLLPPSTRTMNIDGLKFFPTSESTPKMLLDTAEAWAVYNQSIDLYSVKPPDGLWTIDQVLAKAVRKPTAISESGH